MPADTIRCDELIPSARAATSRLSLANPDEFPACVFCLSWCFEFVPKTLFARSKRQSRFHFDAAFVLEPKGNGSAKVPLFLEHVSGEADTNLAS